MLHRFGVDCDFLNFSRQSFRAAFFTSAFQPIIHQLSVKRSILDIEGGGSDMNRKNIFLMTILLAALVVPCLAGAAEVKDFSGTIDMFKASPQVQPFFANAYGYAVFPAIGKGGLIVGGAYGTGQVYLHDGKVTGFTKLVKASIGLQAGGQAFSQVIFFQDKRAYDEFTSGEFAFDAQASAVVLKGGAHAQTGTTGTTAGEKAGDASTAQHMATEYKKGMAIFIQVKGGAMFEAAVAGQKFSFEPL